MQPRSRHTAQEGDTFCLLEMNVLWCEIISRTTACEGAGGNMYKSIYIHSKTSPISTLPERPLSKEEATAPKPPYKSQTMVCNCTWGQRSYFWRNVLWSDETKIELFGHNDHWFFGGKKGQACKPKTPSQP